MGNSSTTPLGCRIIGEERQVLLAKVIRIQQISRPAVAWLCQIVAMRYSLAVPPGCSFHPFFLCGQLSSAYSACVCCVLLDYESIGCNFSKLAAA